jgi:hypothetical protein
VSRRVLFACGAAVLVVLGFAVKLIVFASPEDAVRRYFDALSARDVYAAADQLTDHYSLLSAGDWSGLGQMVSSTVYQPPTGLRVGGWQSAATPEGERVVAVQYELAGSTYSALLKLRRSAGTWGITNGTGSLAVNVPHAMVNGHTAGKVTTLFPGVYEVETPPAALLKADPVTVAVTTGGDTMTRLVTTLTPQAARSAGQRVESIIKGCATAGYASSRDCPFKGIDVGGLTHVAWELVSLPELAIEQTGPAEVKVTGAGRGSVRLTAVDPNGVGIDRVDSFSVNAKCVEEEAALSCTFSA